MRWNHPSLSRLGTALVRVLLLNKTGTEGWRGRRLEKEKGQGKVRKEREESFCFALFKQKLLFRCCGKLTLCYWQVWNPQGLQFVWKLISKLWEWSLYSRVRGWQCEYSSFFSKKHHTLLVRSSVKCTRSTGITESNLPYHNFNHLCKMPSPTHLDFIKKLSAITK